MNGKESARRIVGASPVPSKASWVSPFVSGLLIFCGLLNAAELDGNNYFNVRNYGAVGDGKNLDSPAVDKAVQAASAAGGGTVYVPAGTYLSGSIHLTNNIHLLLDAGAVILGEKWNSEAYDPTEPYTLGAYQDGGHSFFHNSLIWGEGLTNVSITGPGMINGGGLTTWEGKLDEKIGFNQKPPFPKDGGGPVQAANKAIALKLCRGVLIRDVTIFHGGWFAILVTGCDNVTIDNVTIDTNRDGMDIDCCRNVMVSNCRVNSPIDDGICPKSTHVLGAPRLTENLTIVNCQVSGFEEGTLLDGTLKPAKSGFGRIKFGTESSGGFRNITVANCTFRSCRGLALEEVDGGILENFTINNLTMMDVRDYAIYITTGKRNRTPNLTTNSRLSNILISNVIVDGVDKMSGIQIMGLPEQPIEGVRLENIRLTSKGGGKTNDAALTPKEVGAGYPEPSMLGTLPAYGIFARHVRDLELANIHLNFQTNDFRPAAFFADVDGLEIDNLKPQVAAGVRAAVISADVRSLTIRDSPAFESAK
ncbi:MAG: glycoside hydrolase family 28 protein [Verrucomicrobia subdivision 3 bacterium]|nr:glycoside hydrolase family 28 protein [Limisphaerales bacterium]